MIIFIVQLFAVDKARFQLIKKKLIKVSQKKGKAK